MGGTGRGAGARRRAKRARALAAVLVLSLVCSYVVAPITTASADSCRDDFHYTHHHNGRDHSKADHDRGRRWNKAPVGIIIGSGKAFVGTPTKLDASRSFDYDGEIVRYEWDVDNDGTFDIVTTDPVASTVFTRAGKQEVRLRVTDDDGAMSTDRKKFEVRGDTAAPVASAIVPASATVGELVTLDASGSYDCQGEIKSYEWDFDGDGTTDLVTASDTTQYAWMAAGTYTVKLVVRDWAGNTGTFSAPIVVQSGSDATPEPPVGVTAADVPADEGGAIKVTWTASAEADVVAYRVYRATTESGPFGLAGEVSSASFTDAGLDNGITYYYVVTAVDAADQESVHSAVVSATPTDNTAPGVPTGLTVADVPADEGHALVLSWTANAQPDLAGYRVVMTDSVTMAQSTTDVPAGTESWVFDGLVTGRTYSFTVAAYDDAGNVSGASDPSSAAPSDQVPPIVPQDLVAYDKPGDEGGAVVLEWTANAESDLGGYTIYRATVPSGIDPAAALASAMPMASVGADATSWEDATVFSGLDYVYVITAFDESGNESAYSQYAVVQAVDNTPPSAPLYVDASDAPDDQGGVVNLEWAPSLSADVDGYEIQVVNVHGDIVKLIHLDLVTSLVVDDLVTGDAYTFGVSAHDAAGNVSAVVFDGATPLDNLAPAAPADVAATDVVPDQGGSIVVSWAGGGEADLAGYDVVCYDADDAVVATRDAGFATSVQFDGLTTGGTYSFDLTARDLNGNDSPASARVSASANDEVAPDAVTVSAADHPGDQGGVIDVAWSASGAPDLAGYKLYRDGEPVADVTITSYTDAAAGEDERAYTVRAYDASGNLSEPNDPPALATALDNLAPAVPANVTATDVVANESGAVVVSFDPVADADLDGYRAVCFNAADEIVATAEIAALDHSVVFDGLVNGLQYKFVVLAFDASSNESAWSAPAYGTPLDDVAPAAPASVTAADVPADNGGAIAITWAANTEGDLAGYRVVRATAHDTVQLAELPASALTFTDETCTDGVNYGYAVYAIDLAGNVSLRSDISIAVSSDNLAPAAPTLAGTDTPNDNGGSIDLSWNAVDDAVSYTLFRDGVEIATGLTSTTYTDAAAAVGVSHSYVVKAFDAAGNGSVDSNTVTLASADNVAPDAPTGISAADTPNDNGGSIDVWWNAVADAATYRLYRDDVLLAGGLTATTYQDTTAQTGIGYTYTVTAVDAAGNESLKMGSAGAVAGNDLDVGPPTAPGAVTVEAGDSFASVSWLPASDDGTIDRYEVWARTGLTGEYVKLGESTGLSYARGDLSNGVTYWFRVRAIDAAGNVGPFADPVSALPLASPVSSSVRVEDTDSRLQWSGAWTRYSHVNYSGGTSNNSNTAGATATLWFDGTGITVRSFSTPASNRGMVDIYLDDVFVTTVDCYSPTVVWSTVIFQTQGLPPGAHKLTLRVTGQKNPSSGDAWIDVDCFDIEGSILDIGPLATPRSFVIADRPADQGDALNLSWAANTESDLACYRLYRSTSPSGPFILIDEIVGSTSYVDTGLASGTSYYYRLAAADSSGHESVWTAATLGRPADNIAPAAPTGLTAVPSAGQNGAVVLSWSPNGEGDLKEYRVSRSSNPGGPFTLVATVPAGTTIASNSSLTPGAVYYYRVVAVDNSGLSSTPSAVVSARASDLLPPSATVGLTGLGGDGFVSLAWLPSTDNVSLLGYEVWMKTGESGEYELMAEIPQTAYTKSSLVNGVQYSFKVRAKDWAGNLGPFTPAETVIPLAPTGVPVATRVEDSDPSVVWSGAWTSYSHPQYSGGTSMNSETAGAKATLTFSGEGITVKSYSTPTFNRGMMNVYLDGSFVTVVDCYSPTTVWSTTVFQAAGLSSGQHTLVLEVTGTKNVASGAAWIDVDCFDLER